jgi:MalT-like TPR region
VARALLNAERLGLPEVTSFAAYIAGDLARRDGDYAAARELLNEAARAAATQRDGLSQVTALTLTALGYLATEEGDLAAARSWHHRALVTALPSGDASVSAEALTGMASVALIDGDADRAATLLGAADGIRGAGNRSDDDGARVAAGARALLGPDGYSAAFQRGLQVTLATLEAALGAMLTPGA